MSLDYKLDDLASNADEAELQAIEFGAKNVTDQFQSITALANTFVVNPAPDGRDQRARAAETSSTTRCKDILDADEKIGAVLKEIGALLDELPRGAGQADREPQDDR